MPPTAGGAASECEVLIDGTLKCGSNILEVKHARAGGHKPRSGDVYHSRYSPTPGSLLGLSNHPNHAVLPTRSPHADPSGQ